MKLSSFKITFRFFILSLCKSVNVYEIVDSLLVPLKATIMMKGILKWLFVSRRIFHCNSILISFFYSDFVFARLPRKLELAIYYCLLRFLNNFFSLSLLYFSHVNECYVLLPSFSILKREFCYMEGSFLLLRCWKGNCYSWCLFVSTVPLFVRLLFA